MTCWCVVAACSAEMSKWKMVIKPLSVAGSLLFSSFCLFVFFFLLFFVLPYCKNIIHIHNAINNIVIIISTYRSYEYYSVCVLYYMRLLPFSRVCMLSIKRTYSTQYVINISIYWKVSTTKCSFSGEMRMTTFHSLFVYISLVFSAKERNIMCMNVLPSSKIALCKKTDVRKIEVEMSDHALDWRINTHTAARPNKNKTTETHVPCGR